METAVKNVELEHELKSTVEDWVNRTFNQIHVDVLNSWTDNTLYDYILQPSPEEVLQDYLDEGDDEEIITSFLEDEDWSEKKITKKIEEYESTEGNREDAFTKVFGEELWESFCEWVLEKCDDDIHDFIYEQERYPMWNTCFEFKNDWYESEEDAEIFHDLGLGIMDGIEHFNRILFMMSAGHSFYASYWIPMYLALHPEEAKKYKGVEYNHL